MNRKQFLAVTLCALGALLWLSPADSWPTIRWTWPRSPTWKSSPKRWSALEKATDEAKLAGHNSWMLTSCALVLMMTAPGLAMFYSGLVRKKNVLGVMMQCIFLMGFNSVIWALYGYSLAFGGSFDAF